MICHPLRLPHSSLYRVHNFFLPPSNSREVFFRPMRFPWKKVRDAPIFRFLNDHLHKSQKRRNGSSLVVETGFPTSLVDLFVKNREKLKNPSKKARRMSPRSFPSPPPAPASSPVVYPSSPSPVYSGGVSGVSVCGSVDVNRSLLVLLKVFLVGCCVLGSKRVTVGITVSAFLLVFLEYVGRLVIGFLKPCLVAVLMSEMQIDHSLDLGSCPSPTRSRNQEIQVDESEIRFQPFDPETEKGENNYEAMEFTRSKSRREKIKSKIDKCLPKRFRRSRKENEQIVSVINAATSRCSFSELLETDAEFSGNEIRTQPMWRCLFLLLVVLIGLAGGRAFAVLLMLLSCFLLKVGEVLVRYIKVSMMRSISS